jgi:hypothetical protein
MSESGFSEESLRKIAEQKINYRYSILIHAAVFGLVNALLFFINIVTSPSYYWVLLPILGWNIGLVLHFVSYILYARGVYPYAKRGVIYHLFSYLSVMILLFAINMNLMENLTFSIETINWAYYPAIFWGFGLVVHIVVYRIYGRGDLSEDGVGVSRRQRSIDRELQRMKRKTE